MVITTFSLRIKERIACRYSNSCVRTADINHSPSKRRTNGITHRGNWDQRWDTLSLGCSVPSLTALRLDPASFPHCGFSSFLFFRYPSNATKCWHCLLSLLLCREGRLYFGVRSIHVWKTAVGREDGWSYHERMDLGSPSPSFYSVWHSRSRSGVARSYSGSFHLLNI